MALPKKGNVVLIGKEGSLSVAYIATALKNAGYKVDMFTRNELNKINERKREKIKSALYVGFPTYSYLTNKSFEDIQKIRRINKRVIAGGWGVTHTPDMILKNYNFMMGIKGVFGEALDTSVELADYWQNNPKAKEIPLHINGIVYLDGDKVAETGIREPKELPPLHSTIPSKFFYEKWGNWISVPLIIKTFGCPHAMDGCTFCDIAKEMKNIDKKKIFEMRRFNHETVKTNLLLALKKVENIKSKVELEIITDAAISSDLKNFYAVLDEIPKKYAERIKSMRVITRPDVNYINDEFLDLIEKSPIEHIAIDLGVESYHQPDLDLVNKKTDSTKFFDIFEKLTNMDVILTTYNILKISDDPVALDKNLEGMLESIKKGVRISTAAAIQGVSVTGKPLTKKENLTKEDLFYGLNFEKLNKFEAVIQKWKEKGLNEKTLLTPNNMVVSDRNMWDTLSYISEVVDKFRKKFEAKQLDMKSAAIVVGILKLRNEIHNYLVRKITQKEMEEKMREYYKNILEVLKQDDNILKEDAVVLNGVNGRLIYGDSFETLKEGLDILHSAVIDEKIVQIILKDGRIEDIIGEIPKKFREDVVKLHKRVKGAGVMEDKVRDIFLPDRKMEKNISILKRYLTKIER